jgi:hypothetical protein
MAAHDLYVFVRDANRGGDLTNATVRLAHDGGWSEVGVVGTAPDGYPGYYFRVPSFVPDAHGAQLDLEAPNKMPQSMHGRLTYTGDRAYLECDTFNLVDVPTVPPTPEPEPPPTGPPDSMSAELDRITWWYATGKYDLTTKPGCGQFTEAVALDFCKYYAIRGALWGHVKKTGAQNQYQGHAVDAIMCLFGEDDGIWDIIVNSVSSSAHPAYNREGDADEDLFLPVWTVKPQKTK